MSSSNNKFKKRTAYQDTAGPRDTEEGGRRRRDYEDRLDDAQRSGQRDRRSVRDDCHREERRRSRSPYRRGRGGDARVREGEARVERIQDQVTRRQGVRTDLERQREKEEHQKVRNPKTVRQLERSRAALIEDTFGYDRENPFGDDTLAKPFVWKKKIISDATRGIVTDTRVDAILEQTIDKVKEIEDVRRRRVERERLDDELESKRAIEAREKAQVNYDEWRDKEEQFAKGVTLDRVAYRLQTGREGHLDLILKAFILAQYHKFERVSMSNATIHNAALHGVVHGLTEDELLEISTELQSIIETVENAIKGIAPKDRALAFVSVDDDGGANPLEDPSTWPMALRKEFLDYLRAFKTLLNYAKRDKGITVPGMSAILELGPDVVPEVAKFFNGQNVEELIALKPQIEEVLLTASDTNFFEGVLDLIPYYIARGICQRITDLAQRTVVAIEQERYDVERQLREKEEEAITAKKLQRVYAAGGGEVDLGVAGKEDSQPYDVVPQPLSTIPAEWFKRMIDEAQDYKDLIDDRREKLIIYKTRKRGKRVIQQEGGLNALQTAIPTDIKPRKPRFENRVRTGYDWNRYNQTHYDVNNPPPKQVQGYKFNIFYHDLIDPSVTPSWVLEPCTDGELQNTVQLRFTAGPPYQDIAFRILNREWDTHPNANFVNKFEKGILQLHFSLKKLRYRK